MKGNLGAVYQPYLNSVKTHHFQVSMSFLNKITKQNYNISQFSAFT